MIGLILIALVCFQANAAPTNPAEVSTAALPDASSDISDNLNEVLAKPDTKDAALSDPDARQAIGASRISNTRGKLSGDTNAGVGNKNADIRRAGRPVPEQSEIKATTNVVLSELTNINTEEGQISNQNTTDDEDSTSSSPSQPIDDNVSTAADGDSGTTTVTNPTDAGNTGKRKGTKSNSKMEDTNIHLSGNGPQSNTGQLPVFEHFDKSNVQASSAGSNEAQLKDMKAMLLQISQMMQSSNSGNGISDMPRDITSKEQNRNRLLLQSMQTLVQRIDDLDQKTSENEDKFRKEDQAELVGSGNNNHQDRMNLLNNQNYPTNINRVNPNNNNITGINFNRDINNLLQNARLPLKSNFNELNNFNPIWRSDKLWTHPQPALPGDPGWIWERPDIVEDFHQADIENVYGHRGLFEYKRYFAPKMRNYHQGRK